MFPVQIKPCTLTDTQTLTWVACQSYRQHYTYLWHDNGDAYVARCFSEEVLRQELQQPGSAYYLAFLNGQPAGFLKLNLHKPFPDAPEHNALEIERIYLLEEATGKGVGKALMYLVICIAEVINKELVWLKAMDSSPAVTFYQTSGFKPCGTYHLDLPYMKDEFREWLL